MTVARIPLSIATEIQRLRLLGRTDRQIEVFCNLPAHSLDRPYLIDDSEERLTAKVHRDRAEFRAELSARMTRNMAAANDTHPAQPKRSA